MSQGRTARSPETEPSGGSRGLVRSLGFWPALAITVGSMIGTGIYLKPGEVAARAGSVPWAILAWLVGGALSLAGAFVYLELGTAMPATGADYAYLKRGLAPVFGFLYGWKCSVVNGPTTVAVLASACVLFGSSLLPGLQAPLLAGHALTLGQATAVGLILLFSALNLLAVKAVGRIQVVLSAIKVGSILVVAAIGLTALGHAPAPPPAAAPGGASFAAAVNASLWAYSGWHILLRVGGEVRDPARTFPRAILLGFVGTALLFLVVNLACFHVLTFTQVAHSRTAVADMLARTGGAGLAGALVVAMVISALGSLNSSILTGSRLPYAMARDGLLPRVLGTVSSSGRSPVGSVIYNGLFASILVATSTFEQLSSFFVFTQWLFFVLGALALMRLRRTEPELARPVRVPLYPALPVLFVLVSVWLTIENFMRNPVRSGTGLVLVLLGVPVYYGMRRLRPAPEELP